VNRARRLARQLLEHDRSRNRIEVGSLIANGELAAPNPVDQPRHHWIDLLQMRCRFPFVRD
jgi:hypothetical protein